MARFNWYQSNDNNKCSNENRKTEIVCTDRVLLYSLGDIQLRFLCPDDLNEVRTLCAEWFPIEYPFYWYEEITSSTSRFYSLAAVRQKKIVGLIVVEIKPHSSLNEEDADILAKSFNDDCEIAYILSLGVTKKYRRNGIASLLLDALIKHLLSPERRLVKAIFLHVLTTNTPAIKFYERKTFQLHSFLPYYYSINGHCKDGFMYVLYINGGHPPWTLYDYLKFFCGAIVSGGGAIPWLIVNMNKMCGWAWRKNGILEHEQH